jgi:hypothetical protein
MDAVALANFYVAWKVWHLGRHRIWMDGPEADTPSAMIQYLSYGLGHAWD